MPSVNWNGVFSAVATPFAADGSVDWPRFEALLDLLISEGVTGVIVAGSTGEYYSQVESERIELFQRAYKHVAGRVTVIAGTSAIEHANTIALTGAARKIGFDGCMILPPVYCLPTPQEIEAYFQEVADIGLPVMIYNNPARVGLGLTPGLTAKLAEIPNVVAYKESGRDLYAISETYYATRGKLLHFAGLEPYGAALLSRGAAGIVSTISNVCAAQVVAYYNAFRSGDAAALAGNQQVIDQLYHLLSRAGLSNFAFVKSAMAALGRPGGVTRAPHRMAGEAQVAELKDAIAKIYRDAGVPLENQK
ncbi:dihydrodipicolinate synthase family protein [Microbaculum marinum]|uniref:Dihydrodipicolinate synthase family protein n=1 Tax=Microbaculum marinum TaxID=1764581 RepID=A0AAW9RSH6_9HYPH